MSERFGIEVEKAQELIDQMKAEGILVESEGQWRDAKADAGFLATTEIDASVIKKSLKDLLQASANAIDEVPIEQRKHIASVFTIHSADLPRLQKRLASLQREFGLLASSNDNPKDAVYALQISFFPATES